MSLSLIANSPENVRNDYSFMWFGKGEKQRDHAKLISNIWPGAKHLNRIVLVFLYSSKSNAQ